MMKKYRFLALTLSVLLLVMVLALSGCFLFKPAAPSNLTATALSSSSIELSWSGNGDGFIIYRFKNDLTKFVQIADVNGKSYLDKSLLPDTTYYYEVKAKNGFGISDPSSIASATTLPLPPNVPYLKVTSASTDTISLSWTESSTNVTGYKLFRSTDLTTFTQIATITGKTSYTDQNLNSNTKYYYKIKAYNKGGDSRYSNVVSITTKPIFYKVCGYVKETSNNPIEGVIISFSGGYSSVMTDSNGYWTKSELSGQVTVTPSKSGWTFTPSSTIVNGTRNDINFTGVKSNLVVNFPDPNLEALIRKTINKPTGPIYASDLLKITTLKDNYPDNSKKIYDLEGIQYCTNLTDLELEGNSISNISQLASLKKLTNLDLSSNQISNAAPLQDLTSLQYLNLWNNQISDIAPLQNLKNLQWLAFAYNKVNNIAPLKSLNNLKYLDFSYNQIDDITPIRNLTSITELHMGGNPIPKSNWSFIKTWTWLQGLGITAMNLTSSDITFLSNFTHLQRLWLFDNKISDITPLQNLTNLKLLHLWKNQISDIAPLQNLTNIQYLYLSNNQISDITPLVNNTGLATGDYLDIRHNFLDLTPGSTDMNNINKLINRGVQVDYQPQKSVPATPANLQVIGQTSTYVTISWTNNSNDEFGFEIYRSTNGKTFSLIKKLSGSAHTIKSSENWNNLKMKYKYVKPHSNNKAWFEKMMERKIKFEINQSMKKTMNATVGANVTTYMDTNVSAGVTYYYKVRAYNPLGYSGWSNTVETTTVSSQHMSVFYRWRLTTTNSMTAGQVYSSPAMSNNGEVFIGGHQALYYLNGKTLSYTQSDAPVYSAPAIDKTKGEVFVGNNEGQLICFSLPSAAANTVSVSASPLIGAPIIVNGKVYVVDRMGKVYFVNENTMDSSLLVTLPGNNIRIWSSPVSNGKDLFIGSNTGVFFAVNINDGTIDWFYKTNENIFGTAAIDSNGNIYIGGTELWSFTSNGTKRWAEELDGSQIYGSPVISSNGTVYVGTINGNFYALNSQNGSILWSRNLSSPIGGISSSALLGNNGIVYMGSGPTFYALDASNGDIIDHVNLGYNIESNPMMNDGYIYVGCDNGYLYKIQSLSSSMDSGWPMFMKNRLHTGM